MMRSAHATALEMTACARTDAAPLKLLFPELLHDENPRDDRDDALPAFFHPRKCISFALCSPNYFILDSERL
jgi:hypothetical protein